jgi:hypothetical protein
MRQVQKMQEEVERVQAEASEEVVTTSVGGGVVKVTINGALEIQSLTVDPAVVDPEDIEMLQDLVMAAVNEAIQKAQEMMGDRMASVTGGLGLPGIL